VKQRVSEPAIDAVIAALYAPSSRTPDGFPSVREVAQTLKEQYGHTGENSRICDALRRARAGAQLPAVLDVEGAAAWRNRAVALAQELKEYTANAEATITKLKQDLAVMTARAERSEAREETTQSHWMMELDKTKQQLATAEARRPRGVDQDTYLQVCRELSAAKQEIAWVRDWGARTLGSAYLALRQCLLATSGGTRARSNGSDPPLSDDALTSQPNEA
jgi:hypothetical protein